MYDAIVVGARCAGAPTAMLLARAGLRVLMLERSCFPKDTLSTHYLHLPAVARLQSWGLLDGLKASGCPPLPRSVYEVGDVRLEGAALPYDGQDAAYAPRRHVLDSLLAEAAVQSGVDFRQNCALTGLTYSEDGRVSGVSYRDIARGITKHAAAALVIGADGMRSTVARLVGASFTTCDPKLTCAYYSYWENLPAGFELYEQPGSWVGTLRTNGDATLVVTYFPQKLFTEVRQNPDLAHREQIHRTAPELHSRLSDAKQIERIYGTGDQQNYFREASGPGWALVGDAGHHKDSITARGIMDALFQAQLLAECVAEPLAARDPDALDGALDRFGRERDEVLDPAYQGTLVVAQLEVQPERLQILRAISKSQDSTNNYFSAVAGTISAEDLYTPELLAAIS